MTRLFKTGHPIADTVSDLIGELLDGSYNIAYGILRHDLFKNNAGSWFECDRGFWDANHFDGLYRLSYRGTQPIYIPSYPVSEEHGQTIEPWRDQIGYTLICPPSSHVCGFFNINYAQWLHDAIRPPGTYLGLNPKHNVIRHKDSEHLVEWDSVKEVITFNSTIGFEALRQGIPVISDPIHSTIGSYTRYYGDNYCDYDRDRLFSFCQAHQFKLGEKEKICRIINHYIAGSASTAEKQ